MPRLALPRVIGEVGSFVVGFIPTNALLLVGPARLAPQFRFGVATHAVQEGKAALQHGANRIHGDMGDVAQAEISDVARGAMLGLAIG